MYSMRLYSMHLYAMHLYSMYLHFMHLYCINFILCIVTLKLVTDGQTDIQTNGQTLSDIELLSQLKNKWGGLAITMGVQQGVGIQIFQ